MGKAFISHAKDVARVLEDIILSREIYQIHKGISDSNCFRLFSQTVVYAHVGKSIELFRIMVSFIAWN